MTGEQETEVVFWMFAIALFLVVAIVPAKFVRFLGRDRMDPSEKTLLVFRILAGICVLGLIYRIMSVLAR